VHAARVWNSLSDLVTSAPSVAVFRSRLKARMFNISYPCNRTVTLVALDTIIALACVLLAGPDVVYVDRDHQRVIAKPRHHHAADAQMHAVKMCMS